jgi:hypothetical protein
VVFLETNQQKVELGSEWKQDYRLPSADDTLLTILRIEWLAKALDGFIDFVDVAVGYLERLCIAVDRTYRMLYDITPGLETHQRALDLLGEELEFLEVGVQHLNLCAFLCISIIPWSDHGCSTGRVHDNGPQNQGFETKCFVCEVVMMKRAVIIFQNKKGKLMETNQ